MRKRTARLKRIFGSNVKKVMHKAKSIAQEVSHARHKEDIIDIVDNVHPGEQNCKLKVHNPRLYRVLFPHVVFSRLQTLTKGHLSLKKWNTSRSSKTINTKVQFGAWNSRAVDDCSPLLARIRFWEYGSLRMPIRFFRWKYTLAETRGQF